KILLGPELAQALENRGFDELTKVQAAVLDPTLADCDLRITSQTGSGKTVAIGLVLRHALEQHIALETKPQGPCAIVIVPTRELAKQLHDELKWLYAALKIRLACVTGGSSYREELRALGARPSVIVGTPGRLVDHLDRGAIDAKSVSTIVLDEADRMLDLGFADALEAIFKAAPNRKRTHLVSATLAHEVLRLANRYQSNPRAVQGTRPNEANTDIEHIVHVVPHARRVDALVNVLLAEPDERSLVFVRTRIDVTNVAHELTDTGFRVVTLSGDMEQPARERALLAFRQDKARVLVATDVAARGIDIEGMTRVIHLEPPNDPDSYTHRSGRTGRAGKKGSSIVFIAPEQQQRVRALLNQARVSARLMPLPTFEELQARADERMLKLLTESLATNTTESRLQKVAEELLKDRNAAEVVAMLIARTKHSEPEPRRIAPMQAAPSARNRRTEQRASRYGASGAEAWDGERANKDTRRNPSGPPSAFPARPHQQSESQPKAIGFGPFGKDKRNSPASNDAMRDASLGWGMFQVTWGQLQGADPRRLLAILCRRGNIRGADVGAIRIGPTSSIVEVRHDVAADFATNAMVPDPAEPRIRITELEDAAASPRPANKAKLPHWAAAPRLRANGDGKRMKQGTGWSSAQREESR
ncbi:MAG TPA: DEAD/DEAH box helicase, partial [Polyangiaceae bacterium]